MNTSGASNTSRFSEFTSGDSSDKLVRPSACTTRNNPRHINKKNRGESPPAQPKRLPPPPPPPAPRRRGGAGPSPPRLPPVAAFFFKLRECTGSPQKKPPQKGWGKCRTG